jgi:hypothetical protein
MPVLPLLLKTKGPRADRQQGALDVPLVDDERDQPALNVDNYLRGGQASGGMANTATTDLLSEESVMTLLL